MYNKCCLLICLCLHFYLSSMRFYNIITQTQTQTCSLSGWFCSEKWLKYFIYYILWYPVSIITNGNDYMIPFFLSTSPKCWLIRIRNRLFFFIYDTSVSLSACIKAIVINVQKYSPDILWNNIYLFNCFIKVCFYYSIKIFAFGS